MSDVIEAATEWLAALKIDSEASADARVDYEILRDLLADLAAAQAVIAEAPHSARCHSHFAIGFPSRKYHPCDCVLAQSPTDTLADDLDGATTTPPEAALATTAGEFAARWNSTDPASRDKRVSLINEGADIAVRCFVENHIDHIHDLEQTVRVNYGLYKSAEADLAAVQAVIAETIAHHDFRSAPTRGDDYDIVCACGYISLDGENDVCPTVRLLAQSPTDTLAADRARVRAETLAEAAEEWGAGAWEAAFAASRVEDDVSAVQATVAWLRARSEAGDAS